jgi:hypothetical protein
MSVKSINKDEIINMIIYIKQKVSDLSITDRKNILRIIMKTGIDDNKIQSKGNGTQIKFKDITSDTIQLIYNFIQAKITDKIEKLKNFTEENSEETIA